MGIDVDCQVPRQPWRDTHTSHPVSHACLRLSPGEPGPQLNNSIDPFSSWAWTAWVLVVFLLLRAVKQITAKRCHALSHRGSQEPNLRGKCVGPFELCEQFEQDTCASWRCQCAPPNIRAYHQGPKTPKLALLCTFINPTPVAGRPWHVPDCRRMRRGDMCWLATRSLLGLLALG
ncbi:uncharacterized protein B0T15DRAFT_305329 [Chaetomium strumarium]|uniref:Uncharacterized protein n=1 Tax=Chaetomium strumarium TaxID=1170767 RepID=A0AAJ0GM31_9PEZI|nr:hypothetical protein B0T15DRAFT_305329 [Chaetomium strumarium]